MFNVTFVGMQLPKEVVDLYSAADINVISLQKGLFMQHFQGRQQDCLIARKPIMICMDEKYDFVHLANQYGIQNAGTNRTECLKQLILQVKCRNDFCKTGEFWINYFNARKSVDGYCKVIEEMR